MTLTVSKGSIGWHYSGNDANNGLSKFLKNGKIISKTDCSRINLGLGGLKAELAPNEFEGNMYFMIEIDLITNYVSFFGPPFKKATFANSEFGFSIKDIKQPFKFVISFKTSDENSIGIGIVKTDNFHDDNHLTDRSQIFSDQKTHVSNELVSMLPAAVKTKLKAMFSVSSNKSHIYGFNYYSSIQLKQELENSALSEKYEIKDNIIEIIINYCGITNWDIINKSRNINLYQANDQRITYAILAEANCILDEFGTDFVASYTEDTILLNEWFGISNDKFVFRYLFKWFGKKARRHAKAIRLGIVTKHYECPFDQTKFGIGGNNDSIAWYYDSTSFFYGGLGGLVSANHIKNAATIGFDGNQESINNYFLMEINLKSNYIKFEGSGINSNQFGVSITHLQKPFRIGVTLVSPNAMDLGLGIVSLTAKDFEHLSDNLEDHKEYDSDFYPLEVTPLRTHFYPTDIRTNLPNIINERLNHIPNGMNKHNIGYNYYSDKLKKLLVQNLELRAVDDANISNTICEFIGSTKWDSIEMDKNIIIGHSNDGKIEYAILKHANTVRSDTILMNEWIGLNEDKLIYRYLFKWYGNAPRINHWLTIGITGNNFDRSNTYIGGSLHSCSWSYNGHISSGFVRNSRILQRLPPVSLAKGGIKNELSKDENEDLMYFIIEINLSTNTMQLIANCFANIENSFVSIANISKPYRIGISMRSYTPNAIGLGIVEIER